MDEKQAIIRHITRNSGEIFRRAQPGVPAELLSADITLPQLKVMLVLRTEGPRRMSSIASELGVSLPTATGLVDKLVSKWLVSRHADEADRRAVVIQLTDVGAGLVEKVWEMGRFKLEDLLEKLDENDLRIVVGLTERLLSRLNEV